MKSRYETDFWLELSESFIKAILEIIGGSDPECFPIVPKNVYFFILPESHFFASLFESNQPGLVRVRAVNNRLLSLAIGPHISQCAMGRVFAIKSLRHPVLDLVNNTGGLGVILESNVNANRISSPDFFSGKVF